MYRISITSIGKTEDDPPVVKMVEVYGQNFEELDVTALIIAINKKPRPRGPRKKKGDK